jgi:NAD+ kinase
VPHVVFVLHNRVPRDDPGVAEAAAAVRAAGKEVEVVQRPEPVEGARRFDGGWVLDPALVKGAELVVTFGGDGTFLHAARSAVVAGVPLLGVNLGRLGFLTWVDRRSAAAALQTWVAGATELETRATIAVEIGLVSEVAVNEVVVLKHPDANVIQLEASVDGESAGTFHADGAIVTGPTGSTAYSASAGGPLLDPRVDAMVLVALQAHNLTTRPLVVPGSGRIDVSVDEPTRAIIDGALEIGLEAHQPVTCRLEGPPLQLVKVPGSAGFYQQLRDKMGWGRPLVREGRG